MGTPWDFYVEKNSRDYAIWQRIIFLVLLHIPTGHLRLGGHVENPCKHYLFLVQKRGNYGSVLSTTLLESGTCEEEE